MTKQELEQQLKEAEQKVADLKKKIENCQSPEQLSLSIIDGLTIKIDKDKYPNSIFFFKGDKVYFELGKDILWCRYDEVWRIISDTISGDYYATQVFIKRQVEEHFKMKDVTPDQ